MIENENDVVKVEFADYETIDFEKQINYLEEDINCLTAFIEGCKK